MSAVAEASARFAPDLSVPQRDALLDPGVVAERLAARLGSGDRALPITGCERLRAKYQVGRSLRVLHRIEVAGQSHLVAARSFPPAQSHAVYRRALAAAVPTGALRPVAHDPELATVFWTFPNDRKIATLAVLASAPDGSVPALPRRWTRTELNAYAPEKSATARCVAADGETIAFAKVYAGDQGQRTYRVHASLADAQGDVGALRAARALAYSREHRVLLIEPIEGPSIAELGVDELERGLAGLAAALAGMHRRPPLQGAPPWWRLAPERLEAAAALIGRARPDVAGRARALAAALTSSFDDRSPPVCLHGDAHLKNGIVSGGGVVLIDLDQVCSGPRAADLGGLLASLTYTRCVGELSKAGERDLRDAVLAGYGEVASPPSGRSVRWHVAAALLVERALRSVHRVRVRGLEHLEAILEAAEASCP